MVISHSNDCGSPTRLSARLPMLSFVSHNRSTTLTLIRKVLSFSLLLVLLQGLGRSPKEMGR